MILKHLNCKKESIKLTVIHLLLTLKIELRSHPHFKNKNWQTFSLKYRNKTFWDLINLAISSKWMKNERYDINVNSELLHQSEFRWLRYLMWKDEKEHCYDFHVIHTKHFWNYELNWRSATLIVFEWFQFYHQFYLSRSKRYKLLLCPDQKGTRAKVW